MAMQAAARPVHPHMRGVYEGFKLDDTPHYGSSPRAWGLLLCPLPSRSWCRSIPTYVGFTLHIGGWHTQKSVHPHIRGVYGGGLSNRPLDIRSIPTYVGFTSCGTPREAWATVHPHIRGVYVVGAVRLILVVGPSPHTWGLRALDSRPLLSQRSIPTYVGFTVTYGGLEDD